MDLIVDYMKTRFTFIYKVSSDRYKFYPIEHRRQDQQYPMFSLNECVLQFGRTTMSSTARSFTEK